MRIFWAAFSLFIHLTGSGCSSKSSEESGIGTLVEEGLIVALNPNQNMVISLSFIEGLDGAFIEIPAGSLSAAVEVLVAERADLLDEVNLGEIYELVEDSGYIDIEVLGQKKAVRLDLVPTWDKEPPFVEEEFYINFPLSSFTGEDYASLIALEDGAESRVKELNWKVKTGDAGYLRFPLSGFGSYQLIQTEYELDEDQLGNIGSGSWWGYEIDLFNQAASPSERGVEYWELKFNAQGIITSFKVNGTLDALLPGLNFSDFVTDYPYIYDSSDDTGLRPWVWSRHSDYGVMFTASSRVESKSIRGRILQRKSRRGTDDPVDEVNPESIAGRYFGQGVRLSEGSSLPRLETAPSRDNITLVWNDSSFSLEGSLGGFENLSGTIDWPSDELAKALGVLQGTIDADGKALALTLFFSLDQKAFGYTLCTEAAEDECGNGAGDGDLNTFAFVYGLLER